MDEDFAERFVKLRETGMARFSASLLVSFCKEFDPRESRFAPAVKEIASWISLPSDDVRREVVFALCFFRPVPGYEYLILEGWKTAPAGDLHWHASAIEISYKDPAMIEPDLVATLVGELFREPPHREGYPDDLAFADAKIDLGWRVQAAVRSLEHLRLVLRGEKPPPANAPRASTHGVN